MIGRKIVNGGQIFTMVQVSLKDNRSRSDLSKDDCGQAEYGVLSGMPGATAEESGIAAPIHRYPLEAIEKVGFHCV